jgi:hypothetical protein
MYQSDSAPWLWFRAWNTDGSAKTDLVFNTSGIDVKVARDNQANSASLSLSAASSPTDWDAGKLNQVVGNLYRVGVSTALISNYTGNIAVCGSYTGGVLEGIIDSVSAYDPTKNPLSPSVAGRQIAISATTGKVTSEAVELDSAATAALVDLIWDEPLTGATHNVATSSGKRLRQSTAFQQIDSTVIDASATTTTFVTGLTSAVDDFFNDSMLVFTDGALAGQVRAIYDYIGATKTIILEEALTSAPVNGVAFTIVSLHIHPVSQIQSGLATAASIVTLRGADSDTLKTLSDQIDTVSTNVSSIASVSREAF